MPKYRVKAGRTFGPGGTIKAGEEVELTEIEAAGFLDKLELVGLAVTPLVPGLRNDLDAVVPEELKIMPASLVEKVAAIKETYVPAVEDEPETFAINQPVEEKPLPAQAGKRKTTRKPKDK